MISLSPSILITTFTYVHQHCIKICGVNCVNKLTPSPTKKFPCKQSKEFIDASKKITHMSSEPNQLMDLVNARLRKSYLRDFNDINNIADSNAKNKVVPTYNTRKP
eukprot:TRINITY_DN3021_c0_g1_i6.p1 TRINITY_DN3021_c0_g1~~TRINITY_DN3021_c0_g1_i6.p1  ORF type:complete len:106 (-),score=7.86 TRINITY_DN3021_c0_g1_i6:205-522(-)